MRLFIDWISLGFINVWLQNYNQCLANVNIDSFRNLEAMIWKVTCTVLLTALAVGSYKVFGEYKQVLPIFVRYLFLMFSDTPTARGPGPCPSKWRESSPLASSQRTATHSTHTVWYTPWLNKGCRAPSNVCTWVSHVYVHSVFLTDWFLTI